tara:strand:+ start:45 stop:368 length:324 start_codon:yes stop_codon:yes gene_type:complete
MSQRVNIQYSVEIENLQETVDYLYNKVLTRMDRLNQNMTETTSFLDLELIEEIDQIRLELAQIDTQLSDIDNIVKGYLKFKMQDKGDILQETLDELQVNPQPPEQDE